MNCIVVVDSTWGIGKNNTLLFRLPLDLAQYKEKTTGHVCVMGAKTYESLPKAALKNRVNFVLDDKGLFHEHAKTVSSVEELTERLHEYDTKDVFVIGGSSVYRLLLDMCDTAYVTKVEADGDATLFFPNLDKNPKWNCAWTSERIFDNGLWTTYNTYVKK